MINLNHSRFDAAVFARIARQVRRDGDCLLWEGTMKRNAPVVRHSTQTLSVRLYVFKLARGWAPCRLFACPNDARCVHPGHTASGPIAEELAGLDPGIFLAMLERYGTVGETPKPAKPVTCVGGVAVRIEPVPEQTTRSAFRERLAARCVPTWQAAGLRELTVANLAGGAGGAD